LYIVTFSGGWYVYRYSRQGQNLGRVNTPFQVNGVAYSAEMELMFFMNSQDNMNIHVYEFNGEGSLGGRVGIISNYRQLFNNWWSRSMCWVDKHPDGQLWVNTQASGGGGQGNTVHQILIDTDDWSAALRVQNFDTYVGVNGQPWDGIAHDGYNLWTSSYASEEIRIYDDGVFEKNWISYDPTEGELQGGEDMDVTVTLDASGLHGGRYEAELRISSPDPDFSAFTVPVTLDVTAAADIAVRWLDQYGYPDVVDWNAQEAYGDQVFSGLSYELVVTVENSGVLPLDVDEISSDLEIFSVDPAVIEALDPGEEVDIVVTLEADEAGDYDAVLRFVSNSEANPVVEAALHADVLAPPTIQLDPESVETTLNFCDKEDYTVTVSNAGGADLIWETDIDVTGEPERDAGARTLRSTKRAVGPRRDEPGDLIAEFVGPNQQNIYCSPVGWDPDDEVMFFTKYNNSQISVWRHDNYEDFEQVRQFGTPNPMDGGWYEGLLYICTLNNTQVLRRFDVEGNQVGEIGMGFPVYGVAFDSEEGLMFARNQNAGGAIQVYEMDGNDRGGQIGTINNWSQFNGNNVNVYSVEWVPAHPDGQLWMVNNGTHNIYEIAVDTDEWQATGAVQNFPADITQPWDAIAHDGENMWVGGWGAANIRIYDDGVAEMRWIAVDPREGITEPDGSTEVTLTLDAGNLAAGDYSADLHFISNDPESGDVILNVTLHILELRDIVLTPDPLDFGEVFIDESTDLPINVANAGNADLTVSEMAVEGDWFSVDFPGEFALEPGDDLDVMLTFAPEEGGLFEGTLSVTSDATGEDVVTVDLIGRSRERMPNIYVEPVSLDFGDVFVGAAEDLIFSIGNDGDGPLRVTDIGVEGDYLSVDFEGEFTVDPGESHDVTATFAPEATGEVNGLITIVSLYEEQEDEYYVEAFGVGIEPPEIMVAPTDVAVSLEYGESEDHVLEIINQGESDLVWDSELDITQQPGRDRRVARQSRRVRRAGPARGRPGPTINVPSEIVQLAVKNGNATAAETAEWDLYVAEIERDAGQPRRDRRGAADDYGYEWRDNEEDDGPDYEWIDITQGQGQRLNAWDDWNSGVLELGWDFPWYDQQYDAIRVC
ncbi:MAG TPA: choice-of-anchor D domain-containing protein, partial [Bacteroidetes bacterium]|nr:choice-of-anchor D domain-containing protein [Bacteroidota bacterium]